MKYTITSSITMENPLEIIAFMDRCMEDNGVISGIYDDGYWYMICFNSKYVFVSLDVINDNCITVAIYDHDENDNIVIVNEMSC